MKNPMQSGSMGEPIILECKGDVEQVIIYKTGKVEIYLAKNDYHFKQIFGKLSPKMYKVVRDFFKL